MGIGLTDDQGWRILFFFCDSKYTNLMSLCLISGAGGGKPSQHQLPDCLQVCSINPQRELLLPDQAGPQQGPITGYLLFDN